MNEVLETEKGMSRSGGILSSFPRSARAVAMVAALAAGCAPPPTPTRVGQSTPVAAVQAETKPELFPGLILPGDVLSNHPEGYLSREALRDQMPRLASDLSHLLSECREEHGDLGFWRRGHPDEAGNLLRQIEAVRRTLALEARDSSAPFRGDAKELFASLGQVAKMLDRGSTLGDWQSGSAGGSNGNDRYFDRAIADLEWYAHCLEGK